MDSTICAVATPPGEGGIGVIRLSGHEAIRIASTFFRGKDLREVPGHRAVYGKFSEPGSSHLLEEVVCTVMRSPRSYTGEDVVEISAHGNPRLLERILGLLVREGARPAERGEFTKRAFLNGKLDLTQAEAVMDLVKARGAKGMDTAISQLEGKLGRFLKEIRARILSILSPIEAGIDFPEEEVPEVPRFVLQAQVDAVMIEMERLLSGASSGKIVRDGVCAVIAGKPNVGKSSLFNALLQEGRAIVTEIPGTTRDTLEEWAELRGIPVKLVDTAGIRATDDKVERIGISRSRSAVEKADLFLLVLDRASPLESEDAELLELAGKRKSVVVLNKMDLQGPLHPGSIEKLYRGPLVCLSTITGEGLDRLQDEIFQGVLRDALPDDTPLITRIRHEEALERAHRFMGEARETLASQYPLDLVAVDLRGASEAIGEITGERYTEDLLEKIFSEFCIGK